MRMGQAVVVGAVLVLGAVLALRGLPVGVIAMICGFLLCAYALHVFKNVPVRQLFRRHRTQPRARFPGPTVGDMAVVLIGLLFCVAALIIFPSDWRSGLTTLAFFGFVFLVAGDVLWRKLRAGRFKGRHVRIVGQVNIPARSTRMIVLSAGMVVAGGIVALVDPRDPLFYRALAGFVALVGVFMLVALAAGLGGRQSLRFEPAGLVFGERRYSFRVRWDDIDSLVAGEFARNPVVLIGLAEGARVQVEPPAAQARFDQLRSKNRTWMGADLAIMPLLYGFDTHLLLAALVRYRSEPEARSELAAMLLT